MVNMLGKSGKWHCSRGQADAKTVRELILSRLLKEPHGTH